MSLQISLAQHFTQQQGETWAVHFSLDGTKLLSSDGHALYVWRLDGNGDWDYERSLPFQNTATPRFSPDGKMLAFGGKETCIKLISLAGKEFAIFSSPSYADWAFSPDGHWLVSNDTQRAIVLWDLSTYQRFLLPIPFPAFEQREKMIGWSSESVGRFLFAPDSRLLVFGASSAEGYMHLCAFEPEERCLVQQATFPLRGMLDGAISPDGKKLAMVVPDEQSRMYKQDIFLYDLESLHLRHVFSPTAAADYCLLAFSPDSRYLASSKTDGWVALFALDSYACITQFAAHPGLFSDSGDPIGGLDWSKTGYLATGGASVFEHNMKQADYTIKLWKIEA